MLGTRLGPHEIESKLGEGGMGEVYLATDTRLGRRVALKILPAEFSGDPDRLARFEREARAAAALNHPNIAAVFDIGTEGDVRYIVQEYLEGEDLRARLNAGRLPLKAALEFAASVAEGLAVAHDAGIAHRDLKPENVFVTAQGHAKILDFGLAKLTETASVKDGSATQSPTVLATSAGQIMGTAGYMAPEQIAGDEIDGRADLFAFGCLLFEMATGQRAFTGKNLPEVLHRLANESAPALRDVRPDLPAELGRIIDKCLEKEPERRYQGAADLVVDLRKLIVEVDAGTAASVGHVAASPDGAGTTRLAVAALVGLVLGAGLWSLWGSQRAAPASSAPLHLPLPDVRGLHDSNSASIALSPTGRRLAFATGWGAVQLWDLSTGTRSEIEESLWARNPFFSPDGHWLGFASPDGRLYRVPVEGGTPQPFTEHIAGQIGHIEWSERSGIMVLRNFEQTTLQIPELGAEPGPVLEIDASAGEAGHGTMSILPGGDKVLYAFWDDRWRIAVRPLSGGERTVLAQGYAASYVQTGHLVWVLGQQLMGATFDPDSLELGEPVVLIPDMGATPGWGQPGYSIAADGTLAYLQSPADKTTALLRLFPDGRTETIRPRDRQVTGLAVSPSGNRLGLSVLTVDGDTQIWSYDVRRDDLVPVAQGAGWDQYPFFFSDDALGYISERNSGRGDLYRAVDGTGTEEQLSDSEPYRNNPHASATGYVAAQVHDPDTESEDIWVYAPDRWDEAIRLVSRPGTDENPRFSRDGRFLAFESNRSGRLEIYVTPFPARPGVADWKVTTDGGYAARWAADSSAVFYQYEEMIYRAEVISTDPFRTAEPVAFVRYLGGDMEWDLAPDASHVIAAEALEPPRPRLILNWFAEIERRLPTR